MTDHAAQAARLLHAAQLPVGFTDDQELAAATVHAILALVEAVQDIAGAIHLTAN
jgi:hypothetical protein